MCFRISGAILKIPFWQFILYQLIVNSLIMTRDMSLNKMITLNGSPGDILNHKSQLQQCIDVKYVILWHFFRLHLGFHENFGNFDSGHFENQPYWQFRPYRSRVNRLIMIRWCPWTKWYHAWRVLGGGGCTVTPLGSWTICDVLTILNQYLSSRTDT